MGEWRTVLLSDLIEIKHGYAFAGESIHEEPRGEILLTPGNFSTGGGFKSDKFKYFDGEIPEDYVLGRGDLLVTMTDLSKASDTLGYPALVPENHGRRRFLHNQRLGRVRVKRPKRLDQGFLYYLLCCDQYRHEVLASATGTTVKHTSPDRIGRFEFRLPPMLEQRAIAHILGTLDDKIELNRRMNETLEQMARALFKSWFVDFDPVRAKAEGRDTGLPEHIADLFPDRMVDSELGEIPEGWEVGSIEDLAEVVGGSTPRTNVPEYWVGGDICWTTPKDLSGLRCPVLLDTEKKITPIGLGQISSGLLPVGTVLLSSRAPIGYLALCHVPTAVNQGFIAMKPRNGVPSEYLLLWAGSAADTIASHANGSTFLEVSKSNFRRILVLTPLRKTLLMFGQTAGAIFDRIVRNESQARNLASLRDTLLPGLITGTLLASERGD